MANFEPSMSAYDEIEFEFLKHCTALGYLIVGLNSPHNSHLLACTLFNSPFDYSPGEDKPEEHAFRCLANMIHKEMNILNNLVHNAPQSIQNRIQNTLNKILDSNITISLYNKKIMKGSNHLWFFTKKLIIGRFDSIDSKDITLREALKSLVPTTLVLMSVDSLLLPMRNKLDELEIKSRNDSKYDNTVSAAKIIQSAVEDARLIINGEEGSLNSRLNKALSVINEAYNANKDTLANHRKPLINRFIESVNQLIGYVSFIITYPARLYDHKLTQNYVDRWFEKRSTASSQTFGIFEQDSIVNHLKEEAKSLIPNI